jgi:16S rRNA (guanine1207-N2)-methyltransferase
MTEHYYTKKPKSKPVYGLIKAKLRGFDLEFITASGVFSWKKIDRGTWTLVEAMEIKPDDDVLDLGSGYGVMGIVAAKLAPNGHVMLVDVNKRAVSLSKKNIVHNQITNAVAIYSDGFERLENMQFDVILSNLPFAVGLEKVFSLIRGAKEHLNLGGTLQVVGRHTKGGKRVEAYMLQIFGNVRVLKKSGGFRVYLAKNEYPQTYE